MTAAWPYGKRRRLACDLTRSPCGPLAGPRSDAVNEAPREEKSMSVSWTLCIRLTTLTTTMQTLAQRLVLAGAAGGRFLQRLISILALACDHAA